MAELDDAAARVKKAAKALANLAQNRSDTMDKINQLYAKISMMDSQKASMQAEYEQAKIDLAGLAETL